MKAEIFPFFFLLFASPEQDLHMKHLYLAHKQNHDDKKIECIIGSDFLTL